MSSLLDNSAYPKLHNRGYTNLPDFWKYIMVEQLLRFQVVLMDNVIVELMLRAEIVINAIVELLV